MSERLASNMPRIERGLQATEAPAPSRASVMAVALPPIAGLVLVAVLLVAEGAGAGLLSHVEATVSEAAASGSAARALQLIRAGQDPDKASLIPAGTLGSRAYTVTAIDAAILGRRPEEIPILLAHGATVVDVGRSVCLANAVGLPEALPLLGAPAAHVDRDPSVDTSDAIGACLGQAK